MIARIVSLREELKINQEEFAKKIGVSRNFISLVETGKRNLSDRTIADICRKFDVNEAWLRTGKGKMLMPKSRTDEITAFIDDTLSAQKDSFKFRFISALSQLDEADWEALETLFSKIKI